MNQQPQEIRLKINDDQLKGSYANAMKVSYNQEAFVLDFAHITPPQGIVTARIVTSPRHLKQMINAFQNSLKLYEERFGKIDDIIKENQEIGFQTSN